MTEDEKEKIRQDNKEKKEAENNLKIGNNQNTSLEQTTIEKKDKMISVKQSVLDSILENITSLKKDNEMLMYAADKGRLAKYNDRKGVNITRTCRVRIFKEKLVVGWKMIEDIVQKSGNGIWTESQIIEVETEDGEKYSMRYIDFAQMSKVQCDILEKSTQKLTPEEQEKYPEQTIDKNFYTLKITTKGPLYGKEIKFAENYINA